MEAIDRTSPATETIAEFTLKAVVTGVILGLIFGAANARRPHRFRVHSSRRYDGRSVSFAAHARHDPRS
jgi:hypothetical protein